MKKFKYNQNHITFMKSINFDINIILIYDSFDYFNEINDFKYYDFPLNICHRSSSFYEK